MVAGCVTEMHGVQGIHTLVVKTVIDVVFLEQILELWDQQDGNQDMVTAIVFIHIQDQDNLH